jgi:membrane dipeptidase
MTCTRPAVISVFILVFCACGDAQEETLKIDLLGNPKPSEQTIHSYLEPSSDNAHSGTRTDQFVIDLVHDLVFRNIRDGWTLLSPEAQSNVEKIKKGGLGLVVSALPQSPGKTPLKTFNEALEVNRKLVDQTNGAIRIARSFKEAGEIRASGSIPMVLLMEGADVLEGRLSLLGELSTKGLAVVGIVAGHSNGFADVAVAPRENGGLTEKGVELVDACRENGLVVDLTHASKQTFWDTLSIQSGVVFVSHSAARALMDHHRNLNDLQILALARYGGALGLVLNPDFLVPGGAKNGASIEDVVAHVMHIKGIGAIDGLALGTDFNGINPPRGLEDVSLLPSLTNALVRQGLSDSEIAGILGGNAQRVFVEVERERGTAKVLDDEVLRPLPIDCETVIGEFKGSPAVACDSYLLKNGAELPALSKQRIRLKDVKSTPVKFEIFGEPDTLWQVEGQNLEGKVLLNRIVQLDARGRGVLSMPGKRNLTRLFCSPTRMSTLREVVVWGRRIW